MNSQEPPNAFMALALEQAQAALFLTSPNPRVGCVITSKSGEVLGQGHTQAAGHAHAEVMALRDASEKGHSVKGATVYVTLEPCAHTGRTSPCCDALIHAGVGEVHVSLLDPNPLVSGQGVARLQAHGISVHLGQGGQEAQELNIGFLKRMRLQTPWIRSKIAASIDGHTATDSGVSQWITCEASRADGHSYRARACCILTGIGTLLADDPSLDVRALETPRQPDLVVLDSSLRTPVNAKIFHPQRRTYIYCALQCDPQSQELIFPDHPAQAHAFKQKVQALNQLGVTVLGQPKAQKQLDLTYVMTDLARLQMNEVHVEAGAILNGGLLKEGLIDELVLYMAPTWLGSGKAMSVMPLTSTLTRAQQFSWHDITLVDKDLRLTLRRTPAPFI
ncbi:MAG: bifunctional diaminohydroxyphosphoribosylaminopyrimidine deaminase/5-amino-6-(5-phosphoribosylamino)uracil reductase RibD [Betaproteobacteria bacterium]